jgi:hypothetical protein
MSSIRKRPNVYTTTPAQRKQAFYLNDLRQQTAKRIWSMDTVNFRIALHASSFLLRACEARKLLLGSLLWTCCHFSLIDLYHIVVLVNILRPPRSIKTDGTSFFRRRQSLSMMALAVLFCYHSPFRFRKLYGAALQGHGIGAPHSFSAAEIPSSSSVQWVTHNGASEAFQLTADLMGPTCQKFYF